jgi:hypothetical protein
MGLTSALAGKAPSSHSHAQSDVTGLVSALSGKADSVHTHTAEITGTKLDDLAAPDDNTDLNATTGRHGLLPKLGGGTSNFLRADGSWATPSSGSGNFGAATVTMDGELVKQATVTGQSWVTANSIIVCSVMGVATGGTTIEMLAVSGIHVIAANRVAGTGFDLWIYSPNGFSGTVTIHFTGN